MSAMDDLVNGLAEPATLDRALAVARAAKQMNLRYSPLHRALLMLADEVPSLRDELNQALIRAEAAEADLEEYRTAERKLAATLEDERRVS